MIWVVGVGVPFLLGEEPMMVSGLSDYISAAEVMGDFGDDDTRTKLMYLKIQGMKIVVQLQY